jgi:hypothetical protein
MDPLEILLSTFEFILLNPVGIIILIIPFIIYVIFQWSKKRKISKGEK